MTARLYSPEQELEMAGLFAEGMSLANLRRRYGGCYPTVRSALKRQGVFEVRPGGHGAKAGVRQRTFSVDQVDEMVRLWDAGMPKLRMARLFGTTTHIVERELIDRGIDVHGRPYLRGPDHWKWKGGRVVTDEGYVWIRLDGRYVLEHRHVMSKHLGRKLKRSETVHHIDGDTQNNDISNLQLRQGKHGNGVVMICNSCGSHDIVCAPIAG